MGKGKWRTFLILSTIIFLAMVIGTVVSAQTDDAQANDFAGYPQLDQQLDQNVLNVQSDQLAEKDATPFVEPVKKEKIAQILTDKIDKMKDDDTIVVAIWVGTDDGAVVDKAAGGNIAQAETDAKANIASKVKPFVDSLKAKKVEIVYQSIYAPLVFAKVTKAQVKDLALQSDVGYVTVDNTMEKNTNTAIPTVLLPPVWATPVGSVKVAVVEGDAIAFANPYLADGIRFRTSGSVGSHATACAGVIASTNMPYHGMLWSSPAVLSANAYDMGESSLIQAQDWAIAQGARVISNSWGFSTCTAPTSYSSSTLYADYVTLRSPYPTIVFSAGNTGPSCYMQNPAVAFNAITVGSFNDRQTAYNWLDDDMAYSSTSYNSFGRDKPEVAAVGAHARTATSSGPGLMSTIIASPWIGDIGTGTSFASPAVAGLAAHLRYIVPTLNTWPETTKAIIMASATHNIEGSSRLSDRDGVGGINAGEAIKIAKNSRLWQGFTLTKGTGAASSFTPVYLTKGEKVRMVLVWNSKITSRTGTDTLNADLDLYVRQSSTTGPVIASSTSASNNFEIVEFVVPADGMYYPQITKFRWTDAAWIENIGWAIDIQ